MDSPARLLFSFLCCSPLFFHAGSSAVPRSKHDAELDALLRLRKSLAVADWPDRCDPCSCWTGLNCSSDGTVSINLTSVRRSHRDRSGAAVDYDFNGLSNLTSFDASGFPLTGPIPAALGDSNSLTFLSLARTGAYGSIPEGLSRLSQLTVLDLSGNSLDGTIPPGLSKLQKLQTLNLSNNRLSGTVSAELGGLSSLVSLDLSFNSLSDGVPEDLFSGLSELRSIKLDHNDFSSDLPKSILNLTKLVLLDVSNNNLTGKLPVDDEVGSGNTNGQGGVFNLSHNLFYGSIPAEFQGILVRRFSEVDLSSNYFEGREFAGHLNASWNCFTFAQKQRPPTECNSFYTERGFAVDSLTASGSKRTWNRWYSLVAAIFCSLAVTVVFLIFMLCVSRRRARLNATAGSGSLPPPSGVAEPPSSSSATPGDGFSYDQLLKATSGFSAAKLIKNGHSGDLYRGVLEDGKEIVVKRIDLQFARGESYLAELNLLDSVSGAARLVPFLGSCSEKENVKLLVYEYMKNGDLTAALYRKSEVDGDDSRTLDWIKRLKIAIGVAEGLCFLHHDSNPPLVHRSEIDNDPLFNHSDDLFCSARRDIEASSILLDDKYEVRLGSLGEVCAQQFDVRQNVLARILRPSQSSNRGVSGSSTATCAFDIYCMGKVLLEIITGKPGISGSDSAATNKWLKQTAACIGIMEKEMVAKIVDPRLVVDDDHMEEVWAVAVVAKACLDPRPAKRPLARHVLKALESPLKVVREVNQPSFSSSRGSWQSALIGGWLHSVSSVASLGPVGEEGLKSRSPVSNEADTDIV
ncbi:probable LRR receptor-like serine/threonine-protein kinase At2g16250 isoform X1 [Zingiber officinale]|uniref:probable LRR receptor-like serine/threonine-protein kinase At2g16250 isoform X1 n=1 Tax=Zingiber officinale TaxID=94328 RepID=UPI001C4C9021|nr:probable LRR receptor-like serine/threonine-protein kinase At2g16250 isoform X1 [Zingiber officinale]